MSDILPLLHCPRCRSPLQNTSEGALCPLHGVFARNDSGVLIFCAPEHDYFNTHWGQKRDASLPAAKLAAAEKFLAPLLIAPRSPGERWLDVGTGNGVHLALLRQRDPGADLIGIDIAAPALDQVAKQVPGSVLLCADAAEMPLRDGSVDASFSFGVLAYMQNPWRGLAEMVRVTRPGGLIGVWCYPCSETFLGWCFRAVRMIVPKLPGFLQKFIADMIVPFLGFLPTAGGVSLRNAPWAACREVVLVNIAPPHLIFPGRDELVRCMEELGCHIVAEDAEQPITLWARRLASAGP